jgi:ketosteroid isomerase-like protein
VDNVEKLRKAYHQWDESKGGSVPNWLELMTDDVTLWTAGDGAAPLEFTAGRRGKPDIEAYFAGLKADWEMVHFTTKEFIAQGDRVVVLSDVEFKSTKTGKVAKSPKADVFRFRDGQIVEVMEFFDTHAAVTAHTPG